MSTEGIDIVKFEATIRAMSSTIWKVFYNDMTEWEHFGIAWHLEGMTCGRREGDEKKVRREAALLLRRWSHIIIGRKENEDVADTEGTA